MTSMNQSRQRSAVAIAATGVAVAIALAALAPTTIRVAAADTPTVITYGPGEHSQVVPAGVTAMTATATGASGVSSASATGGDGAVANATITVVPGSTLWIEVARQGGAGGVGNGGGVNGTAGGGSTDIWTCQPGSEGCAAAGSATDPRLIVAGGGGGVASGTTNPGGDAGTGVLPCSVGKPTTTGAPGQGGTCSAGGAGGAQFDLIVFSGHDGSAGQGGAGGSYSTEGPIDGGGGGGGGYFGGGGGASSGFGDGQSATSGGGGSSFIKGAAPTALTPGSAVLAAWHAATGTRAALTAVAPTITPAGHAPAGATLSFVIPAAATAVPTIVTATTGASPVGGGAMVLMLVAVGAVSLGAASLLTRRRGRTP